MEQIVRFSPKSAGGGGTAVNNCPFPVGFGGFFKDDPNEVYSGTKWEQKKDVFILASGDTYAAGSTGGEAKHTLTVEEMPSHSHGPTVIYDYPNGNRTANNWGDGKDISTSRVTTGGSQPHNNMPPYFAMPFWIRTA